jgi:DNA-binding NarL/FixJ family response regulator
MAFVLSSPAPLEASRDGLAEHLRRIALEVRAAGLLTSATGHVARPPETTGLSGRQVEVLDRILAGSRVPAIARDLYLSQSTVRNHLSQIFRKYGVHSQVELIELLRERRSA